MIEFKPITLGNREEITSYTLPGECQDSNLSFANLSSWQFMNKSSFAIVDGRLVLRFRFHNNRVMYMVPEGAELIPEVVGKLEWQAKEEGHLLELYGDVPQMRDVLEKAFPRHFQYASDRDYADYIYLREELAELKGKDFQAKRNHVNKFEKANDYRYTPLTPDMVPHCLELHREWCVEHNCAGDEGLANERKSLSFALEHMEELGLLGGAVWVNGDIVAFTYGAPINHNTLGVHAEKADSSVDGAYNIVNREFALHLPKKYVYLNREEDLGVPGLRKAKLSYRPVALLEKGIATKKGEKPLVP